MARVRVSELKGWALDDADRRKHPERIGLAEITSLAV
jgi:hypothetical protein